MANIIHREDHQYKHYNRSFGCKVEGKEHYDYLMKKHGMIPQDQADDLARQERERRANPPKAKLSKEARQIIQSAKNRADKKGNVKLSDRTIDAMKKMGVAIGHRYTPRGRDISKGGFS